MRAFLVLTLAAMAAAAAPTLDFSDSESTCTFKKDGRTVNLEAGCALAVNGRDLAAEVDALQAWKGQMDAWRQSVDHRMANPCEIQDKDGFTLGVNIQTDLGPNFNGWTYNEGSCGTMGANYGAGLNQQGLDTRTIFKLQCKESATGKTHTAYFAGFKNGGADAFSAHIDADESGVVCSQNPDLSDPKFGRDCLRYDDNRHTYWGSSDWDFMWALYTGGSPYTLRHCNNGWDGQHDKGSIWFKKSTRTLPPTPPPTPHPTKAPTLMAGAITDSDGYVLGVNMASDLGPGFNGWTYQTGGSPSQGRNWGYGLNRLGLTTATKFKLQCTESRTGKTHTAYFRGFKNGGADAFHAGTNADPSNVECSESPDFANSKRGRDCLAYGDNHHTYWGNGDWGFMWALYNRGHPYTLRHCDSSYDARADRGSIWFKTD